MNIGFDTIGNAIVIGYDKKPVIATDPWISGSPYFGSWGLSHVIPSEQLEAIKACEYIWVSHGHPDHLIGESMKLLKDKKILLPDHVGGRIEEGLTKQGFDIHVMKTGKWVKLSDNIRALSIADQNQDGVLLLDINGRLIVNMNDSAAVGWRGFIRRTIKQYKTSFFLKLFGGRANMNCYYDEQGKLLPLEDYSTLHQRTARATEQFGCTYFVPFSSFHRMQRSDSIWLQDYIMDPHDYLSKFSSEKCKALPAFVRYNCENDTWNEINPERSEAKIYEPEEFGDNWSEVLEKDEVKKLEAYFQAIDHFKTYLDFICFKVGGKEHYISLADKKFNRGVTFEAPRGSLMTSVEYEIFDDMLIGNFMKATFHGDWERKKVTPDFNVYLGKYADNGRAKSKKEVEEYLRTYRQRLGWREVIDNLQDKMEENSKNFMRTYISSDSWLYKNAKKAYKILK